MRQKPFLATILFLGSCMFSFQNCSNVSFETETGELDALSVSRALLINRDAQFTNSAEVVLQLQAKVAETMYVTNDSTCESGGLWEPFKEERQWTLSKKNEQVAVYVKFRDDRDLETLCIMDEIIHDNIAPIVNVLSSPSGLILTRANETIEFQASDEGSGIDHITCRLNGLNNDCTAPIFSINAIEDGVQQLQVIAVDRAGNQSQAPSVNWTKDTLPPTVAIIDPKPNKNSNIREALFHFSGTDSGSGINYFECAVDVSSSENYSKCDSDSTHLVSGVADGQHMFFVRSVDRAGNRSQPARYSWDVDSILPLAQITKGPANPTKLQTASFEFNGQDDSGNTDVVLSCSLDGISFSTCTSPYTASQTFPAGTHSFYVRATDASGNVSTPAEYKWVVDLSPPSVIITSAPGKDTSGYSNEVTSTILFTAVDAISSSENLAVTCQLDSQAPVDCTQRLVTYSALTAGVHTVKVIAVDEAGNSGSATYSWNIDLTPPNIQWIETPGVGFTTIQSSIIEFTTSDAGGSGLGEINCPNNINISSCLLSDRFVISKLSIGAYSFEVIVKDIAGNMASSSIFFIVSPGLREVTTDLVITESSNSVDVLFIIDNSGSMNLEHKELAPEFQGILNPLDGLNWQVAMSSTDVKNITDGSDGQLLMFSDQQGDISPILSPAQVDPTPSSLFQYTIEHGLSKGSENASGITAVYRSIDRSISSNQDYQQANDIFYRAKGNLAVVVVADADDEAAKSGESYGAYQVANPDHLKSFVSTQLGADKNFTMYGILNYEDSALDCNAAADGATSSHYINFVNSTGGLYRHICENNYSTVLNDIGQNILHQIRTLDLECVPYEGKLKALSGTNVGYSITGNRITFDEVLPTGTYSATYDCVVE